jgi:hypothetical protein
MESEPPAEARLVCAECGATSESDAAGWRAYLDDDGQAVTFCPECAERESAATQASPRCDWREPRPDCRKPGRIESGSAESSVVL